MLWIHFAVYDRSTHDDRACRVHAGAEPASPPFATTKVTDNVYIFRYGGHHRCSLSQRTA